MANSTTIPEKQLLLNSASIDESITTILVCGDRSYDDVDTITQVLEKYRKKYVSICIIHGACSGADTIAQAYADYFKVPSKSYPALWREHGRAAGPIRNQQMLDEGKPSLVLAFHRDIKSSKGTKNMIAKATSKNIPTMLIARKSDSLKSVSIDTLE